MDHKNTTLGKSDGVCDEEKLKADNIILINRFDRRIPLKVYRHQSSKELADYHGIEQKTRKVHGTV